MLAMDFPPNEALAIEYVGLAQASTTAEMQKDILRRALAELFPTVGEMLDVGSSKNNQANSGVFIRCLSCDIKKDFGNFSIRLQEDERFKSVATLQRSQFKLVISTPDQSTHNWNIEIGKRELAWYPMLNADLLGSSGRIGPNSVVIQSCLKGLNCPTTRLYSSLEECKTRVQQWSTRRVESSIFNGQFQKSSLILAEKIPFLSEVKANMPVRVSVLSRNSTLSIKTSARALKNGSIGDSIPVQMQTSSGFSVKQKLLDAVVTGEGEVEVVR
ncbi:MAG: flagella basal body P-ring formation protein FlgA [Silvanigrellaceae bacterium]